jgi:hypothetical protein
MSTESNDRMDRIERTIEFIAQQQANFIGQQMSMSDQQTNIAERQAKMDRTIEFLVEQQAKAHAEMEEVRGDIKALVGAVTTMAAQADADRQIMQNRMDRADERMDRFVGQAEVDRQIINNRMSRADERMDRFEHQAESDRQEMRTFTASIADAMHKLAESQIKTNERLTKLENNR